MRFSLFAVLALAAALVAGQTVTTIDAFGQTVVEVITVDPQLGLPTTQTLQTLTTTTSTSTTTTEGQAGPVGVPQTGQAGATQTVYTYTTTNANGNTVALLGTFTPTYATTSYTGLPPPGTILDYSSWRESLGTNTVVRVSNGSLARAPISVSWAAITAALGAGVVGGAWLALA
ncbi:uncharacterized protein BXZ73DRAFT_101040 [Epithele typhae]|uniref:uncharacterized protein n=1 Tax=Epithele typhae TaxID=378194 RepID=UPI0020084585|nr:uncharacterized protein BXZ73DRAFT_101040 [Epithele typhae]KAH9933657.1 hypothetical protein BXZ73DRAFT_101040 [Epithele typhae]